MKKNTKIAIVAIAAMLLLVPGLASSLAAIISKVPQSCEITPYDAACICATNQQKVIVGNWKWECVAPTELPPTVIPPIDSAAEAEAYAYIQLNDIACQSGSYFLDLYELGPSEANQDQYRVECLIIESIYPDGSPQTGSAAWNIWFYKSDGFIKERTCRDDLFENCPEDIAYRSRT